VSSVCPNGHQSSDADYCSECGAPMAGVAKLVTATAPSISLTPAPAPSTGEICPDCATPRTPGARYCEVCRYDFQAKTSFDPHAAAGAAAEPAPAVAMPAADQAAVAAINAPAAVVAAPLAPPAPAAPAKPTLAQAISQIAAEADAPKLQLRITVDAALDTDPDPQTPCPVGAPDKIFHLDLNEHTLGRQYEYQGVRPEIVIPDGEGISRLHMRFIRNATGNYAALDLNSSNGTVINGKEIEPGIETMIKPGDIIDIGRWTRIFVEER